MSSHPNPTRKLRDAKIAPCMQRDGAGTRTPSDQGCHAPFAKALSTPRNR